MKKLELRKEKIVELTNMEMSKVYGGVEEAGDKSSPSTKRGFTCCWCIKIGGSATTRTPGEEPTVIN